jgi:3-deoxy-manno-octulosonate cytidylyltransferase (CMP-KDO synthetase)
MSQKGGYLDLNPQLKKVYVIIPSRYGSARLPGKPLILLAGRPLILHVLERAKEIKGVDRIIVATDDERICHAVEQEGEEAMMTPEELKTGSDRVGWLIKKLECDIVVNLQGDEPLIDTMAIEQAIQAIKDDNSLHVTTLGFPLKSKKAWQDPNVVKIITDENKNALYFSRESIPFFRNGKFQYLDGLFQHLGVYIFRREFLLKFLKWKSSPFELAEKLEQLRILTKGYKIKVITTSSPSFGVDTPDDIDKVEEMIKKKRIVN